MSSDRKPLNVEMGDAENVAGYLDGFDPDSPEPSANRSARYRHSFAVGRADRSGKPAFGGYHEALAHAHLAEAEDAARGNIGPSGEAA